MVNFTREVDDKTFADATKVVDVHDYHEEICVMDDMCTWTHRDVQSLAVDKKMHCTMCTMCTSAHRHILQCTSTAEWRSANLPIQNVSQTAHQQMRQSMAERMLHHSSQWHCLLAHTLIQFCWVQSKGNKVQVQSDRRGDDSSILSF